MDDAFSLNGNNEKLIEKMDIKEDIVVANPQFSLDVAANRVEKDKTSFVTKKGIFDRSKPEEIKIIKKDIMFKPFWKIVCASDCKFLRRGKYEINVDSDVEAVCIDGKEKEVSKKHLKVSDVISKVSLTGGIYGLNAVLDLESGVKTLASKVLGDKDISLSKKTKLNIDGVIERVRRCTVANLVFDANKSIEDKNIFNKLVKTESIKTTLKNLEKKGKVLDVQLEKNKIINEAKKKVVKEPEDNPSRILEHIFSVDELKLIYVPFYSFVLKRGGVETQVVFNSITEEVIK